MNALTHTATRNRARKAAAYTAALWLMCAAGANAEDDGLTEGAKKAGHVTGEIAHDIGQGAKKVGKAIGKEAKEVGKTIGHAAKEGGKQFHCAVKGKC